MTGKDMASTRTIRARADGAQRIRDTILAAAADGSLEPGARLPTERELVRRFDVPRNAVRRTLAQLEAEGSITRHVGRGTFLAGRADEETLTAASATHTSPAELMEARLRIEPALAELIVTNATASDFERMEACLERAEKAATLDEFELWDAALHEALAEATHNRFVIRVLDMVTVVRQQSEWGKLKDRIVTPERRIRYQQEHRDIVRALKARDAERARASIIAHLQHARRNLFGF
ncbi:MAG TPA: FCD domain-containing protein [Burkholderiales bacterium]|nr:FCD domain-containing protein [Burkholderiales bacterium]